VVSSTHLGCTTARNDQGGWRGRIEVIEREMVGSAELVASRF
jgi:hypothetical protein